MRKRQIAAQFLTKTGGLNLLDAMQGAERLTVLAYHRILDWTSPDFMDFEPNVSASPAMFEQQMAYVAEHFNVISLHQLDQFLNQGMTLPQRPLLITFDDGYMDNYENAYPILKKYRFPAVIFIVTGRMDDPEPLWWDNCAYCFKKTTRTSASLPLIGERHFATLEEQIDVRDEVIEAMKKVPEQDKRDSMRAVAHALGVNLHNRPPVFFSWDEVNELVANRVSCQPHTVEHPILTRIPVNVAHEQLRLSQKQIVEKTGQEAIAFAYPNGMPGDYSLDTIESLKTLGYRMAFTLTPGPAKLTEVQQYPFQIKRVFLSYQDSMEIFATKVMGVPALMSSTSYLT